MNGRQSRTLYLRQPSDHLQGLWACPSLGQQRSARRWCGCTSLRSTRKTVSSGHALLPACGLGNSCKTSLTPSQTSGASGEDGAMAQYYPFPHKHGLYQHCHRPALEPGPLGETDRHRGTHQERLMQWRKETGENTPGKAHAMEERNSGPRLPASIPSLCCGNNSRAVLFPLPNLPSHVFINLENSAAPGRRLAHFFLKGQLVILAL